MHDSNLGDCGERLTGSANNEQIENVKTAGTWYATTTNTGSPHEQGLIIDEATGANIAVAYDTRHGPLLAAAPEMLAVLQSMESSLCEDGVKLADFQSSIRAAIAIAIAKATP